MNHLLFINNWLIVLFIAVFYFSIYSSLICIPFIFLFTTNSSIIFYIITQVMLAFWLVLTYDLLEDRRTDDDSAQFNFFLNFLNFEFEPITILS